MGNKVPLSQKKHIKIFQRDRCLICQYYTTAIVTLTPEDIILDMGGFPSASTRARMNQFSQENELGFRVFQRDYQQYVSYYGKTYRFFGNPKLVLERRDP